MFSKGVSRRWMVNTIGVVFLILLISITTLSFMVKSSAYNSIEQTLNGRADELLNWLSSSSGQPFTGIVRDYRGFPGQKPNGNHGPGSKRPSVHHLHRL